LRSGRLSPQVGKWGQCWRESWSILGALIIVSGLLLAAKAWVPATGTGSELILFYREIIAFARKYVPKLEPLSRLYPCSSPFAGIGQPADADTCWGSGTQLPRRSAADRFASHDQPDFLEDGDYHRAAREEGCHGHHHQSTNRRSFIGKPFGALGDKTITAEGSVRIYGGGPIEPRIGFVIHTRDYQSPPTIKIDEKIAVTSSLEILRDIGKNRGPQKSLIAFGYAGWGPGQLEDELREDLWFTTPADPSLVFAENPDAIWEQDIKLRTQDLWEGSRVDARFQLARAHEVIEEQSAMMSQPGPFSEAAPCLVSR
jgi:Uncharacterized ACR, COG1678